ncbi:hypothetical protein KIL84_008294 [Mauremys mutica]|uniref:Uncharacterized protein n=1 Tax=Mauremys mutica TaxID=74926 RepID=A0A9D3XA04_9SAUR|nr:hypothetical protein KIL84_008294 [Mauremys mutica]
MARVLSMHTVVSQAEVCSIKIIYRASHHGPNSPLTFTLCPRVNSSSVMCKAIDTAERQILMFQLPGVSDFLLCSLLHSALSFRINTPAGTFYCTYIAIHF